MRWGLAEAAAALAITGGCSSTRVVRVRPPEVTAVVHSVGGSAAIDFDGLGRGSIERSLGEALGATGVFRVERQAPTDARLRGGVEVDEISREIVGSLTLHVESRNPRDPVESLPLGASVSRRATLEAAESPVVGARRHIERLIREAAGVVASELRLARAPHKEARAVLREALGSDGNLSRPDRVLYAARLSGVRRDPHAVRLLCRMLGHTRPDLRDAALGSLGELGDPVAVRPIIRSVPENDPIALARVLDIIGRLGGTEAEAFLELIAAGHENAEIRRIAAGARERLARVDRPARPN